MTPDTESKLVDHKETNPDYQHKDSLDISLSSYIPYYTSWTEEQWIASRSINSKEREDVPASTTEPA